MRGIVADVNGSSAVLLNNKGDFVKIRNRNYNVGQEIVYKKKSITNISYIAASFIIFCFLTISSYSFYFTPQNYIGIDINPSIQLGINRFDRIVSVQGFNDDAQKVIDIAKIKNRTPEEAIEQVIDVSKELGYLSDDNNEVYIAVVSKNDEIPKNIEDRIRKYDNQNIQISVEQTDNETLKESKELGLSVSRTKVIKDYSKTFGGDVKANKEKLKDLSVSQIKKESKSKIEKDNEKKNDSSNNNKDNSNDKDDVNKKTNVKNSDNSDKSNKNNSSEKAEGVSNNKNNEEKVNQSDKKDDTKVNGENTIVENKKENVKENTEETKDKSQEKKENKQEIKINAEDETKKDNKEKSQNSSENKENQKSDDKVNEKTNKKDEKI